MRLRRPLLLSAGAVAGVMGLAGAIACQAGTPGPRGDSGAPAMQLLKAAAHTSTARPWTGTHRVVWVRGGFPRLSLVKVAHDPGSGTRTEVLSPGQVAMADTLDADKLHVLDAHYDLVLRYGGKRTQLIEVRRPGVTGEAAVAGRFWVDTATGMVVRRDVCDRDGLLARTSILDGVSMGAPSTAPALLATRAAPNGQPVDEAQLRLMSGQGWPVRLSLPGGMDLFEARLHDKDGARVLQQTYTDGLSTMSLFVQGGELADPPAGTARPVGDGTVWVQPGPPERIIWSAAGHTWTLVSDAPESAVEEALQSLPHTPRDVADNPAARIWRGMAVVGAWFNPFS